jgi:phage baseplate assembly protein W
MSYSLKIVNGDLSVTGTTMDIVQGIDKLTQDLSLWLREAYGIDRFHSSFGSILDNFIGKVMSASTEVEVQAEILRTMQNYQTIQLVAFKNNPSKFSPAELLQQILGVNVTISYDQVDAAVNFMTAQGVADTTTVTVAT